MKIHPLHRWDISPDEALQLQQELAARVDARTPLARCELIAGGDVAYDKDSARCFAGVFGAATGRDGTDSLGTPTGLAAS